jgi:hypothetical protein
MDRGGFLFQTRSQPAVICLLLVAPASKFLLHGTFSIKACFLAKKVRFLFLHCENFLSKTDLDAVLQPIHFDQLLHRGPGLAADLFRRAIKRQLLGRLTRTLFWVPPQDTQDQGPML